MGIHQHTVLSWNLPLYFKLYFSGAMKVIEVTVNEKLKRVFNAEEMVNVY